MPVEDNRARWFADEGSVWLLAIPLLSVVPPIHFWVFGFWVSRLLVGVWVLRPQLTAHSSQAGKSEFT